MISGLLFVPILACSFNLIKGLLFVILVCQDFCILVLYSSTRNRNTSHYFLSPICKEWVLTWDLIYFINPRLRFMMHMSKKEKSYLEKSNQSNLLVASYKSIPKPWLLYSCKSFWNSSSYHLKRLCFFNESILQFSHTCLSEFMLKRFAQGWDHKRQLIFY